MHYSSDDPADVKDDQDGDSYANAYAEYNCNDRAPEILGLFRSLEWCGCHLVEGLLSFPSSVIFNADGNMQFVERGRQVYHVLPIVTPAGFKFCNLPRDAIYLRLELFKFGRSLRPTSHLQDLKQRLDVWIIRPGVNAEIVTRDKIQVIVIIDNRLVNLLLYVFGLGRPLIKG